MTLPLHRQSEEQTKSTTESFGHIDLLQRLCDQMTDWKAQVKEALLNLEGMARRPVEVDTEKQDLNVSSIALP